MVACYALYVHINYTFLSAGRLIIIEDVENSTTLTEEAEYSDDSESEEDSGDGFTTVDLTITSEKPLLLLVEQ